jgi:pilus assembly protein Flp/PilA
MRFATMMLMLRIRRFMADLRPRQQRGQTLVEYGLIVTLLAMAVVLILTTVGNDVVNLFTGLSTHLQDATSTT